MALQFNVNEEREVIIENLSRLITSCGKNQARIAKELEVTETAIGAYVAGRAIPSTTMIRKLCKVLNCKYEDILGRL